MNMQPHPKEAVVISSDLSTSVTVSVKLSVLPISNIYVTDCIFQVEKIDDTSSHLKSFFNMNLTTLISQIHVGSGKVSVRILLFMKAIRALKVAY